MRKILSIVLAGVVMMIAAGCSKTSPKATATEEKKETWERVPDSNSDTAAYKLRANNPIDTASGKSTPILYVGCGTLTMLAVRLTDPLPKSASFTAKVGTVVDGTNAHRQDWVEVTDDHGDLFSPPSMENQLHLLTQILDAKTLKVEFTPKGGSLQSAIFNVEGFKERFGHEPACKSWRDPSRYQ